MSKEIGKLYKFREGLFGYQRTMGEKTYDKHDPNRIINISIVQITTSENVFMYLGTEEIVIQNPIYTKEDHEKFKGVYTPNNIKLFRSKMPKEFLEEFDKKIEVVLNSEYEPPKETAETIIRGKFLDIESDLFYYEPCFKITEMTDGAEQYTEIYDVWSSLEEVDCNNFKIWRM